MVEFVFDGVDLGIMLGTLKVADFVDAGSFAGVPRPFAGVPSPSIGVIAPLGGTGIRRSSGLPGTSSGARSGILIRLASF